MAQLDATGRLDDAAVVMGADGRLLSFQHGGDHAVWWSTENTVTDSTSWAWNSHPLGSAMDGRRTSILDHNGMVQVFIRHPDGSAYTISQTPA